jgi:hypothetical protein
MRFPESAIFDYEIVEAPEELEEEEELQFLR